MLVLYRCVFWVAEFAAKALAPWIPAFKEFLEAREKALERWLQTQGLHGAWWFHVSSVGELEQARPVIEALRAKGGGPVILTYFSRSVPILVKDWSFVDRADYVPLERPSAIRAFLQKLQPRALVLDRYDLWPEMLAQVEAAAIPVALINASTPPKGLIGLLGLWIRRSLFASVRLWTYVDTAAATAWEIYLKPSAKGLVAGDPRVDRALLRVEQALASGGKASVQNLKTALQHRKVLVAGSTWAVDEELVVEAFLSLKKMQPQCALVIVPHEPDQKTIIALEQRLKRLQLSYMLVEPWDAARAQHVDIFVVNSRGLLAEVYGVGQCAYVGGGFGRHVHSVIEPLAHGLPVALGPKHGRSPEVTTLTALEAAFVIARPRQGAQDLARWVGETWQGGQRLRKAKQALDLFTKVHRGAGERVAHFLHEELHGEP